MSIKSIAVMIKGAMFFFEIFLDIRAFYHVY